MCYVPCFLYSLNKTETVISHHRTGNYSFHAFLFNKPTNSKRPWLTRIPIRRTNIGRALSLMKKCLCLQIRFRIRAERCLCGSQEEMGREVRTERGQPGWVQLTSGQSHRSAFLFSLLAGLSHYVSALMGSWELPPTPHPRG